MQAAVGCAQLKKLPSFVEARRNNWNYLREQLADLSDIFHLPEAVENSNPSWFGFLLTVKPNSHFNRIDLIKHLETNHIQTRLLFAGNLLKHPCFNSMRKEQNGYRVVGNLNNTNIIMNDTFWIGVYPGMTIDMLDFMIAKVRTFLKRQPAFQKCNYEANPCADNFPETPKENNFLKYK
jgi:CDP-6-deoxy-D-xylo-4-hexulose-3-dehydrase